MTVVRRMRWWAELPLLIAMYALYSAGRLVVSDDSTARAVDNGLAILSFERDLSLNFEHPLNRVLTSEAWIGIPADFAYASLHYLVTPGVLIWLWKRRKGEYRAMRTWLMLSTLLGLVGFTLVPTCPPRLLDATHGFTDTMAQYGDYGWWSTEASAPEGLGGLTNQYAAMPSLHVGWALWCGVVLWRHGRRSGWLRTLAVAYPLSTTVIVMGTANHYFLDAVAGAAVMGVGLLLTPSALRGADLLRQRLTPVLEPVLEPVLGPVRDALARRFGTGDPEPGTDGGDGAARHGAAVVGGGCETSARTAYPGEAREAKADDDIPRQHGRVGTADSRRSGGSPERAATAGRAAPSGGPGRVGSDGGARADAAAPAAR
ncbi:phosphatase PAP2 family protein [Streptomyces sp. Z26]|uniref:phosphatase PAP2 family protein n=1 Tax=Streptomyces sp. Z26 TaxID=2500177 RepID=UPI000EF142C7|nr:phosphatase PAP2 family protein [Streptomyces sp. Z26]RLL67033.1 phosphatase PAP2 family protein [Streptomyces sp. Z26]